MRGLLRAVIFTVALLIAPLAVYAQESSSKTPILWNHIPAKSDLCFYWHGAAGWESQDVLSVRALYNREWTEFLAACRSLDTDMTTAAQELLQTSQLLRNPILLVVFPQTDMTPGLRGFIAIDCNNDFQSIDYFAALLRSRLQLSHPVSIDGKIGEGADFSFGEVEFCIKDNLCWLSFGGANLQSIMSGRSKADSKLLSQLAKSRFPTSVYSFVGNPSRFFHLNELASEDLPSESRAFQSISGGAGILNGRYSFQYEGILSDGAGVLAKLRPGKSNPEFFNKLHIIANEPEIAIQWNVNINSLAEVLTTDNAISTMLGALAFFDGADMLDLRMAGGKRLNEVIDRSKFVEATTGAGFAVYDADLHGNGMLTGAMFSSAHALRDSEIDAETQLKLLFPEVPPEVRIRLEDTPAVVTSSIKGIGAGSISDGTFLYAPLGMILRDHLASLKRPTVSSVGKQETLAENVLLDIDLKTGDLLKDAWLLSLSNRYSYNSTLDTSALEESFPSSEFFMTYFRRDHVRLRVSESTWIVEGEASLPGMELALLSIGVDAISSNEPGRFLRMLAAPEAAAREISFQNLRQIGLAMHNYHDTFQSFPAAHSPNPGGKPLLSWRVHILPYLGHEELYKEFHLDEPWDSEHNKRLIPRMPKLYRAPNSRADEYTTNYVGISTPNSILSGEKGVRMAEITDGTSNTLLVVEAADSEAVTWTQPKDLEPDMNLMKQLIGLQRKSFLALFADGSVSKLSEELNEDQLSAYISKNGGEVVPVIR